MDTKYFLMLALVTSSFFNIYAVTIAQKNKALTNQQIRAKLYAADLSDEVVNAARRCATRDGIVLEDCGEIRIRLLAIKQQLFHIDRKLKAAKKDKRPEHDAC